MLGRKSDNEKKLDTAKVDLAAANARLQKVIAAEDASANSADAYAIWRSARDDAEAEVRRLDKLIAAIEAGAEDIRKHEAAELMNKRIVAARKQNEAVAERMRTDGVRLIAEVKALARDIAAACLEARAVNVALPAGLRQSWKPTFSPAVAPVCRGRTYRKRSSIYEFSRIPET